jgi:hypothetical protein
VSAGSMISCELDPDKGVLIEALLFRPDQISNFRELVSKKQFVRKCTVLLDTGSTQTLVSRRMIERIGLKTVGANEVYSVNNEKHLVNVVSGGICFTSEMKNKNALIVNGQFSSGDFPDKHIDIVFGTRDMMRFVMTFDWPDRKLTINW